MQGLSNRIAIAYWPEAVTRLSPPLIAIRPIPVPGRYDTQFNTIELDRGYVQRYGLLETLAIITHELAHWVILASGIREYHHHGAAWRAVLSDVGLDPDALRYALDDEEVA